MRQGSSQVDEWCVKRFYAGMEKCPECGSKHVELEYFPLRRVNRCRCMSCGVTWVPIEVTWDRVDP